jgi:hypothetical protein
MNLKSIFYKILPGVIKQFYSNKKQTKILKKGYEVFIKTNQTPHESYMALISLYCSSNGEFNESFNKKNGLKNKPQAVPVKVDGVLGSFAKEDFIKKNLELNDKGYTFFDKKLTGDICEKLYDFALTTPAKMAPSDDKIAIYNPESPRSEKYSFDAQDLINNTVVQQLIMDPVLINIARTYLECEPIFDFPAMWWSTAYNRTPSEASAQFYHFDMDRIKWLKIFFYVNDVTIENGPHCYIQGTHKQGSKPIELLKKGYVRIKDEEILSYYKSNDLKTICAGAGSVFAGDTKCWHKGLHLKKGHRLVLEFEYTSSMFGANYPKLLVKNNPPVFKDFCKKNKIFASNIDFIHS